MDLLVNIDVDDLERAVDFYVSAFGLSVGRRFGAGGAELLGGSAPIYLLVKEAGGQASSASSQVRFYERHWTPVHLDIVVDDIDAAVERATRAGAVLEQAVRSSNWGKLALMADPFGHGFCLVQFVGRGYDEIATTQQELDAHQRVKDEIEQVRELAEAKLAEGKAAAIVAILQARGIALNDADRARITGCSDVATLDRWLIHAISASSVEDVVTSS